MSTNANNDDDIVPLSLDDDDDGILFYNDDDHSDTAATAPNMVDGTDYDEYVTLSNVQTPARSTSQRERNTTGGGEVSQRPKTRLKRDLRLLT